LRTGTGAGTHENHAGGVDEPRPSKIPCVIRNWWSAPVFAALLVWEFYTANRTGTAPNWIWVTIAVAGLIFVVFVNVKGYRK
jgi:hypothetical protein